MPISNLTLEPWQDPSQIAQRIVQTHGEGLAKALANRDTDYQFRQKKTINDLMSKHTGPGGRIDWGRLMLDPEVVANGLGRELQGIMMGNKRVMAATGTDVAAQSEAMRAMGVDPNKMLRAQELPESRTVYPGESNGSGFDSKTVQSVSSFLNGGRPSSIGSGVRSSVGPRGASAPMGDTDPNTVRVPGGVGGVDGAAAGMEPPRQEYGAPPPEEDWITQLQRSYDPAQAMGGGMAAGVPSAGGAGGAGGPPSVESETARKTWAEELVRSGMLREADRDNPEALQAALGNYWDKQVEALGPAPTMAMFLRGVKPGDPSSIMAARADFLKASQEYQKAQQGLAAKFFQGGSETFDKQRTQDLALQGNERAQTQFQWNQDGRKAVESMGLDPARVNPDQAVDLIARKNTLDGLGVMVQKSEADLKGLNGPEAQRAAMVAVVNNLSQVENVGTEAGNDRMNRLLAFAPSVQKTLQDGGIRDVPDALLKIVATDPEKGYQALVRMVELTKEDGILSGQLRAAGMKDPFGLGSHAPAASAGARKVGTVKTFANGRTATWDGHGWRAR